MTTTVVTKATGAGAPTEALIDQNRAASGDEFRDETEGPHCVPALHAP